QVLLPDRNAAIIPVLQAAGFACLADLLYLTWEAAATPDPVGGPIEFESYHDSQRLRLIALVEKTYEATQDCAALNGKRPMDEVLEGYRATGAFRPENWLFVRAAGEDVGVLLLADHRAAKHWELMYMGLLPSTRGRHFGCEVVRHAQRLASAAGADRIVLAVDAENHPAIKMYNETGFTAWDRRTVFVRFAS
ncbi:MAG: GNAT family N-acetyltransferase, partial [Pirellulales bacterium]